MSSTTLSADSSIATWLAHPVGGPILRDLLAQSGQSADALRPVSKLAIKRLIKLSKGAFTQELIDGLIARVEAGDVPESSGAPVEAVVDETPDAPVEREPWVERIDSGRFAGKTVIVTGAGSGIGRATASRIAREGGRVNAVDISQERLDDFVDEYPASDIVSVVANITDDDAIAQIVTAAGERIDGLANIAGIMDDMTPVGEISDAVWKRVFSINVDGTMKLMRAVIPAMLAQGAGSIVNTASEASIAGIRGGRRLHGVEARRRRTYQERRVYVRAERHPGERGRPRPHDHQHRGDVRLAAGCRARTRRHGRDAGCCGERGPRSIHHLPAQRRRRQPERRDPAV